jgi:hypothetical protein
MFVSNTVFVLGAGASHEVGLPVGSGLAELISKKVDIRFVRGAALDNGSDVPLYERIGAKFKGERGEYQKAGWMIRDGILLANSIDDFLDRHAKNERVVRYGKLAIAASIMEGERNSGIFTSFGKPRDESFIQNTANTWYARLLKVLGTGVSADQVETIFQNVAFIDFNYDRCLPHFMVQALQPLYGIVEQRARDIVSTAKIIHPYGSLGDLTGSKSVPFGDPDEQVDLFEVAERIRLYTEQVREHDDIEEIKRVVGEAQRIVFLGFGYHQQNLKIITPNQSKATSILGTAYGVSRDDCIVLKEWLRPLIGPIPPRISVDTNKRLTTYDHINLRPDLKSVDLFDEFARTLMS